MVKSIKKINKLDFYANIYTDNPLSGSIHIINS